MELLKANLINTTTQIAVQSNSLLAENLINTDKQIQYVSNGYNSDLTGTTITISFSETTTISRMAILEHNIQFFRWYYNGVTANAVAITGPTTSSYISNNSATSNYFQFTNPIACTSLSIDLWDTITPNAEKAIGYLLLSSQELDFDRIPNAGGYQPTLAPKQIVHQMSDGGTRLHTIRDKWNVKLKLSFIDDTFRNSLKDVYDQHVPFVFVPFGTYTSWDGILFECVWVGGFEFYRYADNAAQNAYTGTIDFRETAS